MPQNQSEQATEQEAQELERHLRQLADQWRKRLEDPQVAAQVKAGTLAVSPLVQSLLNAFPPAREK